MPSQRSLKSLFLEVIIFVCMFALLGHLSMNFWERFIIQSELSNMKTSLHSLKDTINQIGFAYDNLHRELTGIANKTDKKQSVAPTFAVLIKKEVETQHQQCKEHQSLERRTLRDRQVQTLIKARNCTTLIKPVLYNKSAQLYIRDKITPTSQHFVVPEMKREPGKSVSTITRYPLKSTGTENLNTCVDEQCCLSDSDPESIKHIHNLRCCKDHKRYNAYDNWKF